MVSSVTQTDNLPTRTRHTCYDRNHTLIDGTLILSGIIEIIINIGAIVVMSNYREECTKSLRYATRATVLSTIPTPFIVLGIVYCWRDEKNEKPLVITAIAVSAFWAGIFILGMALGYLNC